MSATIYYQFPSSEEIRRRIIFDIGFSSIPSALDLPDMLDKAKINEAAIEAIANSAVLRTIMRFDDSGIKEYNTYYSSDIQWCKTVRTNVIEKLKDIAVPVIPRQTCGPAFSCVIL